MLWGSLRKLAVFAEVFLGVLIEWEKNIGTLGVLRMGGEVHRLGGEKEDTVGGFIGNRKA